MLLAPGLWQCDICRSIYRFSMKVTLAADLAADLSSEGGEVTAKLNTDQWVVVRQAAPQFSYHSTYINQVRVSGVRTVIVLLNQRNLNLMEVMKYFLP